MPSNHLAVAQRMKKAISHILFVCLLIGIASMVSSCSDNALLDKNIAIEGRTWDYDSRPEVMVDVTDTTVPYHLFLNLRHTSDYKYANVFVMVHQRHPSGADSAVRVEIPLAAPDGRWLGKGTGSLFTHQQLFRENYRFPDTGTYVFSFEQHMRENPLKEITHVGIRIAPVY